MSHVDMISLQVFINAFQSITDEMNMALIRAAYSTNIKDRRDCSCAVYTPQSEVISQTELGTPVHLGIMPSVLDHVFKKFPVSELCPGDHIMVNVPHPVGPGHLNDITVVSPVFIDGKLSYIVANMAHHVDMGGYAPGSMGMGLSTIYQEGLQIPPVKIVKAGVVDRELVDIIKQNVRTDLEVEGDLFAQLACNNRGIKRLTELTGRYGLEKLHEYAHHIFDYSERRMRVGIREVPNGVYEFEDYIEGTARTPEWITVHIKVTVEDEDIYFDFAGSSPQVEESINSNLACTRSGCYYVVKVLIDPGLPPNVGAYRPIHVQAPEGTVVNAKAPAAVANATIIVAPRVVDTLFGALLQAMPKQSAAASNGVTSMFNIGGVDERRDALYSYVETYAGGQGGMPGLDGTDAVQCHMTNTRNAPVEVIESAYPLLVRRYGLVPDSDGPGEFRGGLGMMREIEILSPQTTVTVSTDRTKIKPWGAFGGEPGGNARCVVQHPGLPPEQLPYSKMTFSLERNGRVTLTTPGAGGWGSPFKRDPERVLRDVVDGLISIERARDSYGVVIHKSGKDTYEIDGPATECLRERAGDREAEAASVK